MSEQFYKFFLYNKSRNLLETCFYKLEKISTEPKRLQIYAFFYYPLLIIASAILTFCLISATAYFTHSTAEVANFSRIGAVSGLVKEISK